MSPDSESELLYPHDSVMPWPRAAIAGLQQVLAMFVGCITPAIIFINAVELSPQTAQYLISMSLVTAGIGTFIQAKRIGFVGSGLLSVNGTSFAYLDLLLRAGSEGGVALACGMVLAAVPVQFLLAFFLPSLRRLFPPMVAGVVVLLIGISLIPVAGSYITRVPEGMESGWLGNLALAGVPFGILILSQLLGIKWLRFGGPVLAIMAGLLVALGLGVSIGSESQSESWVILPQFLREGLAFKWELLLPFCIIYLVSSIEAIGDLSATARLSGLETKGKEFWGRLRGGLFSDAIASTTAALFSAFPTATFSQNNGVIRLTGVGSRQVGLYVGVILIFTGLLPWTGALFTAIPKPVIGGVTLVLFGLVAGAGLRMISESELGGKEILVLSVSLGAAMSLPTQKAFIDQLPAVLAGILSSEVATGGLTAVLMSLICLSRDPLPEFGNGSVVEPE
ncbi:MAG: uracil-xanthine permease family protein [Puniceicoccaceae bacterium]